MTAEIVSVGTELLLGQIVDTHAATMARLLAECGVTCRRRTTVGDNLERLTSVLKEAMERADIVITIGGLGPTGDDLTREAIAAAYGVGMEHEPDVEAKLRAWFESRGYTFVESNAKQSYRPACCTLIDNPNGTAPGLVCEKEGKLLFALPGPRGEFNPMAQGFVRDELRRRLGPNTIHSRVLRVCGLGESLVESQLGALMDSADPTVAPYAHIGEVHLRITTRAATVEEAETRIDPMEAKIREILGSAVYGVDQTNLEQSIIASLTATHQTVTTAESMTGGELAGRLTSVPGASKAFVGGTVAYSTRIKMIDLGVPNDLLDADGPVSRGVAEAMAEGARIRYHADYALAITGNAGPTPDVDGKPVGLVFIAVAGPNRMLEIEEHRMRGTREDIRRRATQNALVLLRKHLP